MKLLGLITALCLLLASSAVHANTEITGLFDARSLGMAGTGVAFIDSAAAIPINPAALDQINKLTLSLNAVYLRAQQQAPYAIWHLNPAGERYRSYDTIRNAPSQAVLPFIGGAYRLHERVVVGLAAYPMIGQGISIQYRPAPDELPALVAKNDVAIALIEAGVPVSVRLLDNLSLALMWRVTYLLQDVSSPLANPEFPGVAFDRMTGAAVNADLNVTGLHFGGVQVGLLYRPIPSLRFGLVYRSKVVVEGSGTATTKLGDSDTVLDARQSYTNPHMFRAGVAWNALDRLLLALDFKYLLYAEAFKATQTISSFPGAPEMVREQPLHWSNAWSLSLGAEYSLAERWRLRAGYAFVTSATNPDYALALMSPPTPSTFLSAGAGFQAIEALTVDAAAAYITKSTTLTKATEHNAGPGTYAVQTLELSLSLTYRL
jgi:long-chain fatty acid transport protein